MRILLLALAGCAPVALPEPLSNNAVASVERDGKCTIVTASGLNASGLTSHAYAWSPGEPAWHRLPDVPGPPRIAASAATVRGHVYVLGGYDVAPDHHETSHGEVLRLDEAWTAVAPLPIPIDDAVALAWRDRWIVVVSGWSNTVPVANVQLFDVETGAWSAATAFPGVPVFGHAAAIAGDRIVVVDGVAKRPSGYEIVSQAWSATLDPHEPTKIAWRDLGAHPGPPRYRAAGGTSSSGSLVFAGGTADPYNFDGISYRHKAPSPPLASTLVFADDRFTLKSGVPSMDHRALARCGDALYLIGGMTTRVVPDVTQVR